MVDDSSVRVALDDISTGGWWDGSAFDQGSQTFAPVSSGTTNWSLTLATAALTTPDQYGVVAEATDGVGTIGTIGTRQARRHHLSLVTGMRATCAPFRPIPSSTPWIGALWRRD